MAGKTVTRETKLAFLNDKLAELKEKGSIDYANRIESADSLDDKELDKLYKAIQGKFRVKREKKTVPITNDSFYDMLKEMKKMAKNCNYEELGFILDKTKDFQSALEKARIESKKAYLDKLLNEMKERENKIKDIDPDYFKKKEEEQKKAEEQKEEKAEENAATE